MKSIGKMITVNDAKEVNVQNGDFLLVEYYPRTEAIISEFLSNGYTLISKTQRVSPAMQREGGYSFYIGGWDLLFSKQVEDEAEDDSDEFLKRVVKKVVGNSETAGNSEEDLEMFEEEELLDFDLQDEE